MAAGGLIITYCVSVLIIVANLMVAVALEFMKTSKKAITILFRQMSSSNLLLGVAFLVRSVCTTLGLRSDIGCGVVLAVILATLGVYATGLLFIYIELYVSLKRMQSTPFFSKRSAIFICGFSWLLWLGFAFSGLVFRNPDWSGSGFDQCTVSGGVFMSIFNLIFLCAYLVLVFAVAVGYILTIGQLRRIMSAMIPRERSDHDMATTDMESGTAVHNTETTDLGPDTPVQNAETTEMGPAKSKCTHHQRTGTNSTSNGDREMQMKWLKERMLLMRVLVVQAAVVCICWTASIIINMVSEVCTSCRDQIPIGLAYFGQVMIVIPFLGNGIIYLIRSKEFRVACKSVFCACVGVRNRG